MENPGKHIPSLQRAHDGKVLNTGLNVAAATVDACNEAVKFLSDGEVELAHGEARLWFKAQSTWNAEVFLTNLMNSLPSGSSTKRTIADYATALNLLATNMDNTIPMSGFGVLTRMETLRRIQLGSIAR
jgi:hypothetical protein